MPSLIDLRRRIRAVKSTQQITKAMKTVAASRLRRAQDRIVGARPFAKLMGRVLNDLAERVDTTMHPLLAPPVAPDAPLLVFVVTADKGLCGSFNANILRRAGGFVGEADRPVVMGLVGRKGRDFFVRRGFDVRFELVNIFNDLRYGHAQAVARAAIEEYTGGAVSRVDVIYNEFKSVIQQPVVVEQLLPIPRIEYADGDPEAGVTGEFLFEPTPAEIFRDLLPRHVETQIFRALLESAAAEHAARMTAMDAATRNANEMIDGLTLYMNKVRQATITRELIEVVSGAEAL
ncbi:MAG: ATP synthase F1 subunit gamma [Acidobacteria bacterium]|nr:ATP synthase F1 subunit gamma [Acidobacteriota bacterium]